MGNHTERPIPLRQLSDTDLEFIQQFVLSSGTLKDLAALYGVTYPTIRVKLNQVIERLKNIVETPLDTMPDLLADFIRRGALAPANAQTILELHRKLTREGKKG